MRFNELIAGVRSDVAVKLFGDDLGVLARRGRKSPAVLEGVRGSADVRVEQTTGLPMVRVRVDRERGARGTESRSGTSSTRSKLLEPDASSARSSRARARFELAVRLSDESTRTLDALRNVPVGSRRGRAACRSASSPT